VPPQVPPATVHEVVAVVPRRSGLTAVSLALLDAVPDTPHTPSPPAQDAATAASDVATGPVTAPGSPVGSRSATSLIESTAQPPPAPSTVHDADATLSRTPVMSLEAEPFVDAVLEPLQTTASHVTSPPARLDAKSVRPRTASGSELSRAPSATSEVASVTQPPAVVAQLLDALVVRTARAVEPAPAPATVPEVPDRAVPEQPAGSVHSTSAPVVLDA
jgi:hypothetical protein